MTTVFDSKDIVYFYDDQGIFGWASVDPEVSTKSTEISPENTKVLESTEDIHPTENTTVCSIN